MAGSDEIVSFLDILDLDEELVDTRLKLIMERSKYSKKHLINAIHLLEYKQLINTREESDCENQDEVNFLIKIIMNSHIEDVDYVCKLLNIILALNSDTMLQNSEHLLQQILNDIESEVSDINPKASGEKDDLTLQQLYYHLKLCDSILDTVARGGYKLSMPFLETPLESILKTNEKLKLHFLMNTVPKLYYTIVGYSILDRLWTFISKSKNIEMSLQVLSCLSIFYLPVVNEKGSFAFESNIITQYEFWEILRKGLMSDGDNLRKLSIYLCKRAIDYLFAAKLNIEITKGEQILIAWKSRDEKPLKAKWDNFFILIESLKEKQSNIVLPSLQLFDNVKDLGIQWLNCAYKIGLKHDNTQVKFKCIEYRIQDEIHSTNEANALLDTLNDINIHDHLYILDNQLVEQMNNAITLKHILKGIPQIKWSPVPLYHLSNALSHVQIPTLSQEKGIIETVQEILKIPCNNIILRKAIEVNFTHFISKNLKDLKWKQMLDIYSYLKLKDYLNAEENPFYKLIQNMKLSNEEKVKLFEYISHKNGGINFALIYLKSNLENCDIFLKTLDDKIAKVNDIVNRQYSDKREILNDVVFIIKLFAITKVEPFMGNINNNIKRHIKVLVHYVSSLLTNNEPLSIDKADNISKELCQLTDSNETLKDDLCQFYKSCLIILNEDNVNILSKILPIAIIKSLTYSKILNANYKHEMLNFNQVFDIVIKKQKDLGAGESSGRLMNTFYETSSEIAFEILRKEKKHVSKELVIQFIDHVLDCGGYGCLKWILMIVNNKLNILLDDAKSSPEFNVHQLINKTWNEIEELKSNSQYTPCMESFIDLITHKEILKKPKYNNVIIFYCNKITEYGYLKISPLSYLVKKLNTMNISKDQGQLIYILSDILLFSPIIRKDQRINETVEMTILEDPKYLHHITKNEAHFAFQVQYNSILILSKIEHCEILKVIIDFIMNKIDQTLKNKQRYHGNSQTHKLITMGLQHLLLILIRKHKQMDLTFVLNWCHSLLISIPHQPSVRILLEWLYCFHIILKEQTLNHDTFTKLKLKDLAITSQFNILYWTAKHKIATGTIKNEEFEFVMDQLLANTMGQMFNIRLQAQYLSKKLYNRNCDKESKYSYITEVIEKTFMESCKDKNFVKLSKDFFANYFDLLKNLTPCFIYYLLPRLCDQTPRDKVDIEFIKNTLNVVDANIEHDWNDGKLNKFIETRISNEELLEFCVLKEVGVRNSENSQITGTIQKKYIPWKSMSDIEIYQETKKKETASELILVASLIDKLPNLGGMARTSEVFGVKTYVVDSLRHLQDKIFQGLSVSAERWVNIEEIRPGATLIAYLMEMKQEGYSIVAAEQTSSSVKLQSFKFPKKTVLLLGHEKEGIPCDLLPIMDHCVEIPQHGFVRSLNVHVTAAIFVWEYTRQNLL